MLDLKRVKWLGIMGLAGIIGVYSPTVTAEAKADEVSDNAIVFCSDIHENNQGIKDTLGYIVDDLGITPAHAAFGGDYVYHMVGDDKQTEEQRAEIEETVKGVDQRVHTHFYQGNHDDMEATGLEPSGVTQVNDYYVLYGMNLDDVPGNVNQMKRFLNSYNSNPDYVGKPLFILAHPPLDETTRHDHGGQSAVKYIDTLNQYGDEIDIFYIFGHSHTEEFENTFVKRGETIDPEDELMGNSKPINFTYLNAGFITNKDFLYSEGTSSAGQKHKRSLKSADYNERINGSGYTAFEEVTADQLNPSIAAYPDNQVDTVFFWDVTSCSLFIREGNNIVISRYGYPANGTKERHPVNLIETENIPLLHTSSKLKEAPENPAAATDLTKPSGYYSFDDKNNLLSPTTGQSGITGENIEYIESGKLEGAVCLKNKEARLDFPKGMTDKAGFSWAAWVKLDETKADKMLYMGKDADHQIILANDAKNEKLNLSIRSGGKETVLSAKAIEAGHWVHLGVVIGEDYGSLYVDGERTGKESIRGMDIGNLTGTDFSLNGSLCVDEVYIYKHALTANDMRYLKNGYIKEGLVVYLPFDEAEGDRSQTALLEGKAVISKRAGIKGGALYLDGQTGSYASLPEGTNLMFDGDYTFSVWVNLSKYANPKYAAHVIDLGSDTETYAYLATDYIGAGPRFIVKKDGTSNGSAGPLEQMKLYGWNHLVVTYTSGKLNLYMNGKLLKSDSCSGSLADLGVLKNCWIGRTQFHKDSYLSAYVDELRMYNRALTTDEVLQLYQSMQSRPQEETITVSQKGLEVYLPFDEVENQMSDTARLRGSAALTDNGYIGKALYLDGTSGTYAELPSGTNLAFKENYTFSVWVNLTKNQDAVHVLDMGSDTDNYVYLATNYINEAGPRFIEKRAGVAKATAGPLNRLEAGRWNHLAVTCGDGNVKLYLNGNLMRVSPAMSDLSQLGKLENCWIGRTQFAEDPYLKGYVDELKLYSRTLSEDEIYSIYKMNKPLDIKKPVKLPFEDIGDGTQWYQDAVEYVYVNAIMTGKDRSHFAPNAILTRAEFAVMLYRLDGEPEIAGTSEFPDVSKAAFYYKAANWAKSQNIITGYGDGRFGSLDIITREQMATIMFRYGKAKGYDISAGENIDGFPDVMAVSSFAREAFQWCYGKKIITGNSNGTLAPQDGVSRAVAATIFMRFMDATE